MKRVPLAIAALLSGLMATSVLAGEPGRQNTSGESTVKVRTPVVTIIALSGERAREFSASRERFREVRSELYSSNEQYIEHLLADVDVSNH